MSNDAFEKIKSEILNGFWRDLRPHAEREAMFIVDPELDLVEVGVKVFTDDANAIGKWIQENRIVRPAPDQIAAWNDSPEITFRFVIVAPYVLVQAVGH